MSKNGFEQLNSANEKIQQFVNETLFVQEETDYKLEGVTITPVDYHDLQETVDFLLIVWSIKIIE